MIKCCFSSGGPCTGKVHSLEGKRETFLQELSVTSKQKYLVSDVYLLSLLQLNMAKDSETVLEGFQEGPLKFPPTYKFDVGTNTYDTRLVLP